MEIVQKTVKSILTSQRQGFLSAGPYPFTHALSPYIGCGFGKTTCGLYCYAQYLPNWSFSGLHGAWGEAIVVKENAAAVLDTALHKMSPLARRQLRIIMSSATDPYQPVENTYHITRQCLEVFARYADLDLLLLQTRSPLAARDLDLLRRIPYLWLSVTIETDDQDYVKRLRGGPALARRWELVGTAAEHGIATQIAVSPCLSYTTPQQFGQHLLRSGACRVIVDTPLDGDGTGGARTARSQFARIEDRWNDTTPARQLYLYLLDHAPEHNIDIGWSSAGFSGIAPRHKVSLL